MKQEYFGSEYRPVTIEIESSFLLIRRNSERNLNNDSLSPDITDISERIKD